MAREVLVGIVNNLEIATDPPGQLDAALPDTARLLASDYAEPEVLLLHTRSRLHKSRTVSNRCSFFVGAAGGFCIPRAQQ